MSALRLVAATVLTAAALVLVRASTASAHVHGFYYINF